MHLEKVISGGQTGADQAGLRAARAAGIPTGGCAPKGWDTEDGPAPWLAEYGLTECPKAGYPARTAANARDSDGTIWFGTTDSSGYATTIGACTRFGKSYLFVSEGVTTTRHVTEWMETNRIRVLNVAGNRESNNPGLGAGVEEFLGRLFRGLSELPDSNTR
jgi:predicted Rossmann-fold nucleotide-binding protein